MALQPGMGYFTDLQGLNLEIEVVAGTWQYRITQIRDNRVLTDWAMPPPQSGKEYREPENVKFAAVEAALRQMGSADDPHEVFSKTNWCPYGPGHGHTP